LTWDEIGKSQPSDGRAEASIRRNSAVQTFGNLTTLTQALNSAVSNGHWSDKRPELLKFSLLPINQYLGSIDTWDEEAIARRGQEWRLPLDLNSFASSHLVTDTFEFAITRRETAISKLAGHTSSQKYLSLKSNHLDKLRPQIA
jgi:hypothetical protein